MLAEGRLQVRQIEQEVRFSGGDKLVVLIQTGAGDQAVNVRVKLQPLCPGMQHGHKSIGVGAQGFVGGELLAQGAGNGGEEQVESLLGARPEKTGAQLSREGEGDQEIGRIDEFAQLSLCPAVRAEGTALGAGFVVAGVIGKVNVAALFAAKGTPAQCRGAAAGDRPDGAVLLRGERRSCLAQLRNKTAQRLQHCGGSAHVACACWAGSAGQAGAEPIHQAQRVLAGLMRQVQIHHRGSNLLVTQEFLDRVQVSASLQ